MKYLFLDFDGVLNTNNNYTLSTFDPVTILALNKIVENTNCNIVISSSWRENNTLIKLKKYLQDSNFLYPERIVDVTPTLSVRDPETGYIDIAPCRGLEILAYVRVLRIKQWVAIDDMTDEYMRYNLVQTNYENGLTDALANIAIEKLNNETLIEKYVN